MQLNYTEKAITDIAEILDWIAIDNPKQARIYIGKVKEVIELLQFFPNMGVICKSKGIQEDCRVMVFEAFLIFYSLTDEAVVINTVIHTSRDH